MNCWNNEMRITVTKSCFLILSLLTSLLAVGCNDGDPVVFPDNRISSPDEFIDQFKSALIARDIEVLVPLFDHDTNLFTFYFKEEDVEGLQLPACCLNMEEMIKVWRNVFSGQEILNSTGDLVPGIPGFEVNKLERNTNWTGPEDGEPSWHDIKYNIQKVFYRIDFTVVRSGDHPPLSFEGYLGFHVRPPCSEAPFDKDCQGYALHGIEDGTWSGALEGACPSGPLSTSTSPMKSSRSIIIL
jgi:hypothetical protein